MLDSGALERQSWVSKATQAEAKKTSMVKHAKETNQSPQETDAHAHAATKLQSARNA
jgi:hypothetical protein